MSNTKVVMGQASNQYVAPTFIEDVFSTYLYTGNGSTQTITNDIDLAGEGGLVWIKHRNGPSSHALIDTERGRAFNLRSDTTEAQRTSPITDDLTSFNANGFSLGPVNQAYINAGSETFASWTFRKAPRFFDVVTYTGTGSARTVNHNLGTTVGSIIIKRTDTTSNWAVYHRGNTAAPETDYLSLNLTSGTADDATYWNDTAPTDSVFTVGTNAAVNASGATYVAYLYAHDPLGPSGDGSDGLIACGSYAGGTAGEYETINLGWEPQWLLIKRSDSAESWFVLDNMRGLVTGGEDRYLLPNSSAAEGPDTIAEVTPTGFRVLNRTLPPATYIYIAIRRGPMRAPESGTEVFALQQDDAGDGNAPAFRSDFPVDAAFSKNAAAVSVNFFGSRLQGANYLRTSETNAEAANADFEWDYMNGWNSEPAQGPSVISWMWKRAPGFFDVVAYTGDGVAGRTVPHNLGVAPEMMIVKNRSAAYDWLVWNKDLTGNTYNLVLNTTASETNFNLFSSTAPDASSFYLGSAYFDYHNASGNTYIAYLFATLAGVSKVGSYTGNGSSQTIDCGFTTGARFIIIKRTDSTGDWYVWDTARGIVTGNDPHLSLNTTAAEVTTDDSVDPDSSGFIVNQVAATNINVSAASYIFYAIA